VNDSVDRAARKVVSHLRKKIAAKPQAKMFSDGELWKKNTLSISERSARNISRLRSLVTPLSPLERAFFSRFEQQPFYATHFTGADRDREGVTTLYSRKNLIERGIAFPTGNTQDQDLKMAAHDDYVFFALEVGSTPQKTSSRFGDVIYRFSLKQSRFEYAWLSLNDMVAPKQNNLEKYFRGFESSDYDKCDQLVNYYNTTDFIFSGPAMFVGVALSIVHCVRQLSVTAQRKLLAANTIREMNNVLNGLFRPELKVARFVVTGDFAKLVNAGGTSDNDDSGSVGYDLSDYWDDSDDASVYSQD